MKHTFSFLVMASAVAIPVVPTDASELSLQISDTQYIPGMEVEHTQEQRTVKSNEVVTPTLQALIEQLQPALKQRQQQVALSYEASSQTYGVMLEDALKHIFQEDEYLNFDYSGFRTIKGSITGNNVKLELEFDYKQTQEQEQFVQATVKKIISEEIHPSMTKHEKIKALYDYVVRNVQYDTSFSQAVNAPYFALTEGKTLCNGYAMLMYHLLNEVGVETRLISGEVASGTGTIGHAWNLVNVDGQWYHLDATWGDPIPDQGDKVSYDYYMITDAQIAKDHYWQEGGLNGREKPYPVAVTSYFETLMAADEVLLLKGINQWLAPQLLANDEAQYISSLKYQMERLISPVQIYYTGKDVQMITDNMAKYVNEESDYFGEYFRYKPLNITYQNNIVARFKYDFPNYSLTVDSVDIKNSPASIANNEELPLVITMQRSDGVQFDVTDLATIEVENPEIIKVYQDRLKGLKSGVTDVTASFNGKQVTKQLKVEASDVKPKPEVIPYPFTGYKDFGTKTNVPAMKIWTIHMSQPVTKAIQPEIVVTNQYGEAVQVTVDITGKKIVVQPPVAGYQSGETYYLTATYSNSALNMSSKFTIE